MFTTSNDGTQIYFEIIGSGETIVLLHGLGADHSVWSNSGWISELEKEYKLVLIDLRGCGKSGKPETKDSYSIKNHCNDIDCVLKEINENNPFIWGWSLGATIALEYSAKKQIKGTIACGSYFGVIFSKELIQNAINNTNDKLMISRFQAFNEWPIVNPGEMKNKYLIYTGSKDGNVVIQLQKQKNEIESSNGKLVIFNSVDHIGLITEVDLLKDTILRFLKENK